MINDDDLQCIHYYLLFTGMLMVMIIVIVNIMMRITVCCSKAVGTSTQRPHCCTCTKMCHSVLDNRTDLASGSAAVFALCRLSFPHHNCDHTLSLSISLSLLPALFLSLSLSLSTSPSLSIATLGLDKLARPPASASTSLAAWQ